MGLPASTKEAGLAQALPDVCNTPSPTGTVPVPYPNLGMLNVADETVSKVLIMNKEVVVESSKLSNSQGDEAGSIGGVASGTFGDEVSFTQASSKVSADGKKIVFVTAMTAHNGSSPNAPVGNIVVPSQSKVLVSP